jgi:hypothetical protein
MKKKYPFKFLDNYSKDDTEIFFGRQEEIESLYEMIFQTNILLVYGASGTGKTSLIQCGLAQKFQTHDWLSVYIRRGNNLNESLERVLAELAGTDTDIDLDWLDELSEETETFAPSLSPIQSSIRNIYQNSFKPVYLIFDQFEELYILGSKDEQEQFIKTVKEILEIKQPVKLIFSIREEYLGYLFNFEKAVPQLLRKKLRVEPMNIDKVQQVISGVTSFENTNIHVNKEDLEAVTNGIFEKLKARNQLTIQLPYLQVFLDKFYLSITSDETRQADALFTTEALDAIGDIDDVLSDFLEEQVETVSRQLKAKYPDSQPKMIWEILSPFASLEGTKVPTSKEMLYDRLPQTEKTMIDEVVEAFVNCRILRVSDSENLYEIAHDSLAVRIADKRSDEEIALLEVHRLIKSQTSTKEEARELFTEKQLAFISPFIEKLHLTPEERSWIDKSQEAVEYKKNEELRMARAQAEKERQERLEEIKRMKEEQQRKDEERKRKARWQRIVVVIIIGFSIVVAFVAWDAIKSRGIAEDKEREAVIKKREADSALRSLRESQFTRNFEAGNSLMEDENYMDAIIKYRTALQFDSILGLTTFKYLDSLDVDQYLAKLSVVDYPKKLLVEERIRSCKRSMDSETEFNQTLGEAQRLFNQKEYVKALEKYIEADKLDYKDLSDEIFRKKEEALKIYIKDTVDYNLIPDQQMIDITKERIEKLKRVYNNYKR